MNYVGKGGNLYESGYEYHGSSLVVSKLLGATYLWDKVRVSGGAYGGFCRFDPRSGDFKYLSYRDPNLGGTLETYDGAPAFLKDLPFEANGGCENWCKLKESAGLETCWGANASDTQETKKPLLCLTIQPALQSLCRE